MGPRLLLASCWSRHSSRVWAILPVLALAWSYSLLANMNSLNSALWVSYSYNNPGQVAGAKPRVQHVHHPHRHAVKHDGAERLRVERSACEHRLGKLGAPSHSLGRHGPDVPVRGLGRRSAASEGL